LKSGSSALSEELAHADLLHALPLGHTKGNGSVELRAQAGECSINVNAGGLQQRGRRLVEADDRQPQRVVALQPAGES
jgi:hypothetical protein